MITAANVTIQFGAKPLFENVSMKFGNGNRYGLIGANGSGKSTFMKILSGEIQPSSGNVSIDADERIGVLRQDQFAFEEYSAIDTVIMGHERLWQVKQEKDAIYALAAVACARNYVRPRIQAEAEDREIMIRDGRHPVLETLRSDNPFVPNDTRVNNSDEQILIITGPNMAGKSVVLRQTALIVLLLEGTNSILAASPKMATATARQKSVSKPV